jgi:hypothetical protein
MSGCLAEKGISKSSSGGGLTLGELAFAMQRPLITGASVSADLTTESPGKRLSLRYTDRASIRTIAQGGRSGRATISTLSASDFKDRTAIIAMDLFFWDSVMIDTYASLKALKYIVTLAKNLDVPLLLGEIPLLLPSRQPGANTLNDAIHSASKTHEKCFVMPFRELLLKVLQDGFLLIDGKQRCLEELIPDGLHLSDLGAEYLADVMRDVFLGRAHSQNGK